MTNPTTSNKAIIIPNTGADVGTWGSADVNPNMTAVDGMLGGVQTLSLSAATTFTLSAPTGSITPSVGPNQAQNAVLKFTGTLSGNALITLPLPGYYIVENNCTVGAFYIQMRAVGTGNIVGLPPGEPCHIYCDGTDVKFVNMGRVGGFLDLCTNITPAWMTACTIRPYLLCDGSVYSTTIATALANQLGSTFGGNGASTFGVPDLRGRYRIPIDTTAARITVANSGLNGAAWGAAGGDERPQAHLHGNNLNDLGHSHLVHWTPFLAAGGVNPVVSSINIGNSSTGNIDPNTTGMTITNATTFAGGSGNVPPAQVAGLTFIKT